MWRLHVLQNAMFEHIVVCVLCQTFCVTFFIASQLLIVLSTDVFHHGPIVLSMTPPLKRGGMREEGGGGKRNTTPLVRPKKTICFTNGRGYQKISNSVRHGSDNQTTANSLFFCMCLIVC